MAKAGWHVCDCVRAVYRHALRLTARVTLWASRLLVIFSPLLVGLFLLASRHNAALVDLVPAWSDDIMYWHQAQTFAAIDWLNGLSLVGITTFAFLFYEVNAWNDFRLFAPHILLALLLFVVCRRYVAVRPIMPAQGGWLYENLDAACG